MQKMKYTLDQYIYQLINYYVTYFDVYRDQQMGETPLAFLARYQRRDEKYLMTKTIKIWGVENQQFVFVATNPHPLSKEFISQFEKDIKDRLTQDIPQHQEHMSTVFVGVVVTDQPVSERIRKGVRKYRKIKFIKYGLHGWAEIYLAIVDLTAESIYIHPKGKGFMKPYELLWDKKEEEL